MLKPTDPAGLPPVPNDERPIGELVHELIENGKAYAKAEVNVVKATATSKVSAVKTPAILFGAITVVTGPTVVLPLLRHTRLERRIASFLKWEAIVNDPVGAR